MGLFLGGLITGRKFVSGILGADVQEGLFFGGGVGGGLVIRILR